MHPLVTNITINQVKWNEFEQLLREVRTPVFIEEQHIEPDFEWDELDLNAVHLLAIFDNQPVGCLRIISYQKIGRMAVLKPWRGLGIGSALLTQAIEICRQHSSQSIFLSAQTHAIVFYIKAGFKAISQEYTDVNIAHVDMQLILNEQL